MALHLEGSTPDVEPGVEADGHGLGIDVEHRLDHELDHSTPLVVGLTDRDPHLRKPRLEEADRFGEVAGVVLLILVAVVGGGLLAVCLLAWAWLLAGSGTGMSIAAMKNPYAAPTNTSSGGWPSSSLRRTA